MAELFNPEGVEYRPVSPKLTSLRMLSETISLLVTLVIIGVIWFFIWGPWTFWQFFMLGLAILSLVIYVWRLWLIPRQVRAMGYYEGEKELYIRTGIMFRNMTVVPYGRMQYVDMEQGPFQRWFGLATVELHTASASSDASIPGLPQSEADRLRETLSARGESLMAGI
ncbi:hypothetical protein BK816_06830 [Boudabousia tangfeifanii]|uniref:YdbS-like PH domain-containing protein n=1 Tax=Boudabousia tangfeifanii TaxID=1912795 RepID=A0A1D9ML83_9ACTO|nr:PH domain-containing protein [Boudabousia tangfeifanii]AOZ73035.1 hypothetical protein BK816_06830 [Boudabousia tangfeifanii]